MPNYGMIVDGALLRSSIQLEGYKPIEYQPIPDDFDQATQYAVQTDPVDKGDVIFIGIEIHDLPPEDGTDEMV